VSTATCVKKVIDVLYAIANETSRVQRLAVEMINTIKSYEAAKPKQHHDGRLTVVATGNCC
jgi:hypothetical protein